ncbi:MAG: hypothetical protein ACRETZ_07040 [Steroidobacteraceae bacterium]
MRTRATAGNIIFALAVMGLGIISLATDRFASVWEPVPKGLPARHAFAYANGVVMLLLGAGLLRRRARVRAAFLLTGFFVLWFILLHIPIVVAAPGSAGAWSGFGECGTLIVGAMLVFAGATSQGDGPRPGFLTGARGIGLARVVFALAAFLMSLGNLAYLRANADFPPAWIPHWMGWGYLVGLGFIATGLAVLCRTLPRLATYVAAWMMTLLTLGCWVSFVIEAPGSRVNWTGLMISSAIAGAGWLLAETYGNDPWLALSWRPAGGRADSQAPAPAGIGQSVTPTRDE